MNLRSTNQCMVFFPCDTKGESHSESLLSVFKARETQSLRISTFDLLVKKLSPVPLYDFIYTLFIWVTGLLGTSYRNVIFQATFRAESSSVSNNIKFQIFSCLLLIRLNVLMFMQKAAIMAIIFCDILMFGQSFLST